MRSSRRSSQPTPCALRLLWGFAPIGFGIRASRATRGGASRSACHTWRTLIANALLQSASLDRHAARDPPAPSPGHPATPTIPCGWRATWGAGSGWRGSRLHFDNSLHPEFEGLPVPRADPPWRLAQVVFEVRRVQLDEFFANEAGGFGAGACALRPVVGRCGRAVSV
jgi:hypothetical protein